MFNNVDVKVINSVVKKDWIVDFLVLDEIHTMAAETFFKVFQKVSYKIILGLTGTIDRLDGKQTLLTEKCPIIDQLSMEEAITNGWLSPYIEYKVLIDVDDLEDYKKHNEVFIKNFAVFNFDFELAMNCVSGKRVGGKLIRSGPQCVYDHVKKILDVNTPNYQSRFKELQKEISACAYAWNRALIARKDFVMNHPKKIEITKQILAARKESKAITFSATIKSAEKIGEGFVLHSGKTKKKRGITKDEFDKLDKGVMNTSKALDCGEQ